MDAIAKLPSTEPPTIEDLHRWGFVLYPIVPGWEMVYLTRDALLSSGRSPTATTWTTESTLCTLSVRRARAQGDTGTLELSHLSTCAYRYLYRV